MKLYMLQFRVNDKLQESLQLRDIVKRHVVDARAAAFTLIRSRVPSADIKIDENLTHYSATSDKNKFDVRIKPVDLGAL